MCIGLIHCHVNKLFLFWDWLHCCSYNWHGLCYKYCGCCFWRGFSTDRFWTCFHKENIWVVQNGYLRHTLWENSHLSLRKWKLNVVIMKVGLEFETFWIFMAFLINCFRYGLIGYFLEECLSVLILVDFGRQIFWDGCPIRFVGCCITSLSLYDKFYIERFIYIY